eukprot:TRINITY_DN311_c0_g1_i1.p2 TRINITY_DN311_c0_g1~~TRINITY_DN311_c0_g1_i1.p2  ORF type:complete len:531 (-),score=197.72 TRINITY_DN311_c0_g1_i1:102-1634(-)
MRTIFAAVLALFVVGALAQDEAKDYDDSDVLKLTTANFQSTIDNTDFVVVKFFAPWCGHCKHLAPEYAKAATALKGEQPAIVLAEVDATVETELGQRFQIQGYPTLKMFRKGTEAEYQGPRDFAGIVKYLKGMNGPAARTLDTVAAFEEVLAKKNEVFTVGFFAEGKDRDSFDKAAESLRKDYNFYVVTKADVIAAKNAGANGIVTYRTFEGETPAVAYTASLHDTASIREFVKSSSVPLASVFTPENAARYSLPRVTLFAKVDLVKDPSGAKYFLNRMRKAAASFVGKLHFVVVDKSSPDFAALNFGEAAVGMAVLTEDGKKFKADAATFTIEAAKRVAQDFLDGKLEVYVKSQPIPTDNESRHVKTVVGKTVQKEVLEAEEDVFIKFYAPWCGHCKSLAPIYEELAERMSKFKTLKIVEYDATENDVPPMFSVRGFPTVYLLKANDKAHPVAYEGEREADAMESWLRENVSQKLEKAKDEKKKEKDEKKDDKKKEKKDKKKKDKKEDL